MSEAVLKRAEPDSPNRCQATGREGQCPYLAVPGGTVCQRHGGNKVEASQEAQALRNYRFTKYRERINEKADSPKLKLLNEEIGVLRMSLESIVNTCQDDNDLIRNSGPIASLIRQIEMTVQSCDKLERNMGRHFDKQQLIQFAAEIVTIAGDVFAGEDDKLAEFGDKILETITFS